jgi:flagellar basal-body rod modification protein FlgD
MANAVSNTQVEYMTILVEQLKHQNPLEPMDNSDMTSQLTQFSQLELLEGMNGSFAAVLQKTQQSYAETLLGKTINFYDADSNLTSGVVDRVYNNIDGEVLLGIGDSVLGIDGVVSVSNEEPEPES